MSPSPRADVTPLTFELLRRWPLPSDPDGDKHERGTVLVVGGSATTPGAALLAGMAALRAGAGRLQIATDPANTSAVAVAAPEAKVVTIGSSDYEASVAAADAIVVGPGLDDVQATPELLRHAFETSRTDAVLVVDACALASITPDVTKIRADQVVLTPNRSELDQLLEPLDVAGDVGASDEPVGGVARAFRAAVTSFGVVCASDGRRWVTDAGHPCLGTSGSGDVLAGLVGGVAARSGDAAQAACWGTLVHLAAGEHLGAASEPLGFLARELIDPATIGAVVGRFRRAPAPGQAARHA